MNDPAKPPTQSDSDWLNHLETLDGIKEESVEIKEEPIDDIADIKQEDPIYYVSSENFYFIQLSRIVLSIRLTSKMK